MRKTTIFALGFASAFALPITRAFITGIHIGIASAKADLEKQQSIAQYHLSTES